MKSLVSSSTEIQFHEWPDISYIWYGTIVCSMFRSFSLAHPVEKAWGISLTRGSLRNSSLKSSNFCPVSKLHYRLHLWRDMFSFIVSQDPFPKEDLNKSYAINLTSLLGRKRGTRTFKVDAASASATELSGSCVIGPPLPVVSWINFLLVGALFPQGDQKERKFGQSSALDMIIKYVLEIKERSFGSEHYGEMEPLVLSQRWMGFSRPSEATLSGPRNFSVELVALKLCSASLKHLVHSWNQNLQVIKDTLAETKKQEPTPRWDFGHLSEQSRKKRIPWLFFVFPCFSSNTHVALSSRRILCSHLFLNPLSPTLQTFQKRKKLELVMLKIWLSKGLT